ASTPWSDTCPSCTTTETGIVGAAMPTPLPASSACAFRSERVLGRQLGGRKDQRGPAPTEPPAVAVGGHDAGFSEFDPRASEVGMTKPTNREIKSDEVPDDIRQRVIKDFGPELADGIYRYLLDRIPDGLPHGTRPRHLRCILYLAKGDRTLLDRYIEMCLQDP